MTTKTTTISLALLGLTCLGSITWLALHGDAGTHGARPQVSTAETRSQARPMPSPTRSSGIRSAPLDPPRWVERPRHDDDAEPAEPVEPPEPPEPGSHDEAAAIERVTTHVADAFTNEPIDGRWASAAAVEIERVTLAMLPEGSAIEEVACRNSMCRLTSVLRDEDAYRELTHALARSETCHVCLYVEDGSEPDGRPRMVVYLAREGTALPLPEA
ncbi:hypothetical protein [Paraliomyxa miuraensis]|uniref:hypothetical protein n=1 Tax=Paraliomyxa miuraensis TaxID=376150 RepID=UPI002253BA7A|nr:hypothetical protein [Paraliomyxa miuraensis]MCX4241210.1 hypothetical protein [Paraliomyxa miuraensis]